MIEIISRRILQAVALLVLLTNTCTALELLQSLEGTIGKENFTYYRLSRTGDIRIELESVTGDADLVVSDETLSPDFENNKLYSVTYGIEAVDIPRTFDRPVGIGIYGHSYYESSKYIIRIYAIPLGEEELTYEQLMDKFYKYEPESIESGNRKSASGSSRSQSGYSGSSDEEEDEGSILWQIIITLLKVVFEVLL